MYSLFGIISCFVLGGWIILLMITVAIARQVIRRQWSKSALLLMLLALTTTGLLLAFLFINHLWAVEVTRLALDKEARSEALDPLGAIRTVALWEVSIGGLLLAFFAFVVLIGSRLRS
jgi:hypothetical protein